MNKYKIENSNFLKGMQKDIDFSFFNNPLMCCLNKITKDNIDYKTEIFLTWLESMSNIFYSINKIDDESFLKIDDDFLNKLRGCIQNYYKKEILEEGTQKQIESMQVNINNPKLLNAATKQAKLNLNIIVIIDLLSKTFFQEELKEKIEKNKKIFKIKKSYLKRIEMFLNEKIVDIPEINLLLERDKLTEFKSVIEKGDVDLKFKGEILELLKDFKNVSINDEQERDKKKLMIVLKADLDIEEEISKVSESSSDMEKYEAAKKIHNMIEQCFDDLHIKKIDLDFSKDILRELELLSKMKKSREDKAVLKKVKI